MVHAGGSGGFVNNALLMFKSGSTTGDYHQDMNHNNFMQWVHKQLLPNLPDNAVLVIDNASYHNIAVNKDPTFLTLKKDMIEWLQQRGIAHDPSATKLNLYKLIQQHKPTFKQYVLDTELARHGHVVLRLPPYHPQFNPIEKIWAMVKQYVASRNTTFKLNDAINLAKERFNTITAENWAKICKHVDKVVAEHMEKEHLLDKISDEFQFIVNTGDSEGEESSDEDEDLGVSCLPDFDEPGPSTR